MARKAMNCTWPSTSIFCTSPGCPSTPTGGAATWRRSKTDRTSLLSWYRSLTALRRAVGTLRRGSIRFLDAGKDILACERADAASGETIEIILNFSSRRRNALVGKQFCVLLGSRRPAGFVIAAGQVTLGPCEVVIARQAFIARRAV